MACNWQMSPFPTAFFTRLDNFLLFLSNFKLSSANTLIFEESKICCLCMGQSLENNKSQNILLSKVNSLLIKNYILILTLYHTMTTFDSLEEKAFGKQCEERGKMLVTSNFSFPHNVFYSIKDKLYVSSAIYFVVFKCFQF